MVGIALSISDNLPFPVAAGVPKLSQNYLICQNRSTMKCRGRFQTCPFFRNLTKGGFQTRPYSGCLLSTANCNSIRHPVGSVSALMSWHDLGFTKNSETVSPCRSIALCIPRVRGMSEEVSTVGIEKPCCVNASSSINATSRIAGRPVATVEFGSHGPPYLKSGRGLEIYSKRAKMILG